MNSLDKYFDYGKWNAQSFFTARPFKRWLERNSSDLIGKPIAAVYTLNYQFYFYNDYDNDDSLKGKKHFSTDDPIILICGGVQFEIWFYNYSHVKVGINTLNLKEKPCKRCDWTDASCIFPNIIGKKITEIKLFTFSKGFYDSVATEDICGQRQRPDGGDYFSSLCFVLENDFVLSAYGDSEYMNVQQNPKADMRLFPTNDRVYLGSEVDRDDDSPYISFVPYSDANETEERVLHLQEDDFVFLHWAIRHNHPKFSIYESLEVSLAEWGEILADWCFIFDANTFDEVLERFCGADYNMNSARNDDLLSLICGSGDAWNRRDADWGIYQDFVEWNNTVMKKYSHIIIVGI
jgi:hypothetical protein